MSAKSNPHRDELFAQYLSSGMPQLEAYHAAGFKGDTPNASRKANTPEMLKRVADIRAKAIENLIIDKQWVVRQLIMNHNRAFQKGMIAASNQSLELIGRELGMFVDRKDIRVHAQFERLTDRELLQQLKEVTQQLAIEDKSEAEDADTPE